MCPRVQKDITRSYEVENFPTLEKVHMARPSFPPPVGTKFTAKNLLVSPGRNQNYAPVERMRVEVLGWGRDYWRGEWGSPNENRLEAHTRSWTAYDPGADWHVRFEDGRECRLSLSPKGAAKVIEIAKKK